MNLNKTTNDAIVLTMPVKIKPNFRRVKNRDFPSTLSPGLRDVVRMVKLVSKGLP